MQYEPCLHETDGGTKQYKMANIVLFEEIWLYLHK